MDVHNKETRSHNMRRISSKDTLIEIIVRRFLYHRGFRYSLQNKKIPGNPDIAFPKYKIAIFLNGCFFHNHQNCALVKEVKTNEEFWLKKIQGNVARDIKNLKLLKDNDWKVIILWECEIEPRKKQSDKRESNLKKLQVEILKILK